MSRHLVTVVLVALFAACADPKGGVAERGTTITAGDTAELAPDHRLALDVRSDSYVIDPVDGPVDLRFVDVIYPDGHRVAIRAELDAMVETGVMTAADFARAFTVRAAGDHVQYNGSATPGTTRTMYCYVCVCDEYNGCRCFRVKCQPDPDPI